MSPVSFATQVGGSYNNMAGNELNVQNHPDRNMPAAFSGVGTPDAPPAIQPPAIQGAFAGAGTPEPTQPPAIIGAFSGQGK